MSLDNLHELGDLYYQYFDPVQKSFEVRRKSRTEGNISINECMEYIDAYLRKYQLTFVPNKLDKNVIFFPFMFNEPAKGDKIHNITTNETYTVDQAIKNPDSRIWEGLVRLNLQNPPSVERLHALDYHTVNKLVRFEHEVPDTIPNPVGANLERLLKEPPSLYPTVTWTIISVEPGTLGTMGSSRKEWKPRLRESVKDPLVPGHTIEIYGQRFENTVQFDCWSNDPRTSDQLVKWFEQFMRLYSGHLRRAGTGQIMFLKRNRDESNQTWRQSYSTRGSRYLIETEQLDAAYSRDILNLDISISTSTTSPPNRKFNETRWIADQMVTGELNSEEYRALFYRSGEYLFGGMDIRQ
jgi:hypothetical protein